MDDIVYKLHSPLLLEHCCYSLSPIVIALLGQANLLLVRPL